MEVLRRAAGVATVRYGGIELWRFDGGAATWRYEGVEL